MSKINLQRGMFLLILAIFSVILANKNFLFVDPDFGWHYKMGEYITHLGIPTTDPFSYTMPSFPFVDHEWLTNYGIYHLYNNFGNWGLSMISIILVLGTFLIIIPRKKWFLAIPFLPPSLMAILFYSGIRPQIITWFLFAILCRVLFDEILWKRFKSFLPLLFILWVNLHGGFAVGIVILAVVTLIRIYKDKVYSDLIILILSIIATFINPYGVRIWYEVWMQITDTNLRWSIVEWYPMLFRFEPAFSFYTAIAFSFLFRYFRKFELPRIVIFICLFLAAMSSQRHVPLWVIFSLPIVIESAELFYLEVKNIKDGERRLRKVTVIFTVVSLLFLLVEAPFAIWNGKDSKKDNYYPQQALQYLKNQKYEGELFSTYNWGGYLIWQYPEKKVFVDGRMPSWRRQGPKEESNWAFKDYQEMVSNGTNLAAILNKYQVRYILWPIPKEKLVEPSVLERYLPQFFMNNKEKAFSSRLEELGWKKVYQDDLAVVYKRP